MKVKNFKYLSFNPAYRSRDTAYAYRPQLALPSGQLEATTTQELVFVGHLKLVERLVR